MSPVARRASVPDLFDNALPYHILQNLFAHYLNLQCSFIRASNPKDWRALVTTREGRVSPMDFENLRQWKARMAYNERSFARVVRIGRPYWGPQGGLHGIFVPVMRGSKCLGVLQSGVFLTHIVGEPELLRMWRKISGRTLGARDGAFLEFTRSIVSTPVLDGPLIKALAELMGTFGSFLAGDMPGSEAASRMEVLQRDVFARSFGHRGWLEWQVLHRTFFRFFGYSKEILPWEKQEFRIKRFPNTVLVAVPEATGKEWTDLLFAARIVRFARRLAPELGDTLVYPHGGEGVLLLTHVSTEEGKARAEIEFKAGRFIAAAERSLGRGVWVGVGRADPDGTHLVYSYQEAIVAVQMAIARNLKIVHFADLVTEPLGGDVGLRHRGKTLVRACTENGRQDAAPLLMAYIHAVLVQTRGRPEVTRRAFHGIFNRLLEMLEDGHNVAEDAVAELEARIQLRLETAVGYHEMVDRFKEGWNQALDMLEAPAQEDKVQRIQRAASAVNVDPQEPWTLPVLAKRFGFSASSFSRAFPSVLGQTFSAFLLSKRLEMACRMLRAGLPLQHVAHASGFTSTSYFSQAFKRKFGVPPGRYAHDPEAQKKAQEN